MPETVVESPANVQAPEPAAPTTEVKAYRKRNCKQIVCYDPSHM